MASTSWIRQALVLSLLGATCSHAATLSELPTVAINNLQLAQVHMLSAAGKTWVDAQGNKLGYRPIANRPALVVLDLDLKGGTIKIDSLENVGTHCKIVIDYDIAVVEKTEPKVQEDQVFDLGGKKILVVEDNAINQMVIKMIVKKWLNTEAAACIP